MRKKGNLLYTRKHAGFTHVKTIGAIAEYVFKKNGLRVLFKAMPGTGSVTVNIVYRVGSRHEARGVTGIAHMLEHMMFKETIDKTGKRMKPRYIALQNKGALLNATTSDDRTNYYFTLPSEYLPQMLEAEAERMRGLQLTAKEFVPEQQNVLSEYEMYSENPTHLLHRAVIEQAFVSHGYGHDTIGHKSDIEALTCASLAEFYNMYYWPNNAHLVVVGDVALKETLGAIARAFAHIPSSPHTVPVSTTIEPPCSSVRTVTLKQPSALSLTAVSYRAPAATDPMWSRARLTLAYLAEGKLSLLHKRLIETHKASTIMPYLSLSYDPHLFTLMTTVSKKSTPTEVQQIIQKSVAELGEKMISVKDLARIKNKILSDILFERDGTHDIAQELIEYIAAGDWTLYYTLLDSIKKVTAHDVMAYAKQYLQNDCCVVGTFIGTDI